MIGHDVLIKVFLNQPVSNTSSNLSDASMDGISCPWSESYKIYLHTFTSYLQVWTETKRFFLILHSFFYTIEDFQPAGVFPLNLQPRPRGLLHFSKYHRGEDPGDEVVKY